MSVQSQFGRHKEARDAGWFSRRHPTFDEHYAARGAYLAEQEAKRNRAMARQRAAARRTPDEQLALLDARLGPNIGATRERARLANSD